MFNFHPRLESSAGGLVSMWRRLREVLFTWHLVIRAQALRSSALRADETGWRVNGKTHRLWCFTSTDVPYYMIDRRRGSPALKRSLKKDGAPP